MTVVIAVPGSDKQAHELAARLGATLLVPEVRQFPDGELYVRIDGDVKGSDVVIVGSLHHPGAGSESRLLHVGPGNRFLLIAFLAGTARDLGARSVGLVAPYLSYLRQD
ncbi:MAG: ribose-phosphate pyrophosphokinase-like domain-containing protein, partial [Deltaproteobacteria bacterium]|nr:ribose-phosphate pyrophosphokinase-like domain-containing protein [Deltaproteobacteria bacterium]